jgi:hypothetical protein
MEWGHWRGHRIAMTLNELRAALERILEAEQSPGVDWPEVEKRCKRTLTLLNSQPAPDYTDDIVYVFLDDAMLRRDDADYARIQHERLRNWLDGSEIISR